MSWRLCKLRQS